MIRLQQYLPGFIEAGTGQIVDCLTWEDLLCVPWVEAFMHPINGQPFHRFSHDGTTLIAEYADGAFCWVVGFVHQGTLPVPPFVARVREDPK